ncbi:MAG TPA: response regulator [Methanoregula sp.]|nr:response regulator [Methanoregula sp.]
MYSVLLVDDEPALLEMMVLLSRRSSEIAIEAAPSAKEALRMLADKSFDAIILDYEMPEINGIAFLKLIRSHGDTTPVIIFTGAGGENTVIEALNNGADFFIKKDDDPRRQFREITDMVKRGVERRFAGRAHGSTQKIIGDMINFASDPSFAIDHEGKVIAWNDAMEQLTDVSAKGILGKGDFAYAEPFFGRKRKMLVDLIFAPDGEIIDHKYMIVNRVKKGPIIAVTTGTRPDKSPWTLWMKAMPAYDSKGNFIGAVGAIRDITSTIGDVPLSREHPEAPKGDEKEEGRTAPESRLFGRILGKAIVHYRKGVTEYTKNMDYHAAIEAFDQALKIDPKLAFVWSDRGLCFRALNDHSEALKSLLRAVELAPENPEMLFNLGETLETIGVLYMSNKYLDSAVKTFQMVVNQMPNNANAWNHIGVCMKEMGKSEQSKFYFDRARDIKIWKKDTPIVPKRDEYI